MNATTLRQEIHAYIDAMPDRNLQALEPLLSVLAEPNYVIETDLTDEEHLLIAESVERYHKDPSSFVPLETLRRERVTR
jgi:predicted Zn-dependent peptidase